MLLGTPGDPGRSVKVLRFVGLSLTQFVASGVVGHLANHFRCRFGLKGLVSDRDRPQREGGRVTYPTLRPQVANWGVGFVFLLVWRLVYYVSRTVSRDVTEYAFFGLIFGDLFWQADSCFEGPAKGSSTFPFLCLGLGVSKGVRVFIGIVTSLLLFQVFSAPVPVERVVGLVLFIRLRVRFEVTQVRANFSAVQRGLVFTANLNVLIYVFASATGHWGQARTRYYYQVNVRRHVASRSSVLVVRGRLLFFRGGASCAVSHHEGFLTFRLAGMLVASQAMVVPLVLVGPRIGFNAVLCSDFVR